MKYDTESHIKSMFLTSAIDLIIQGISLLYFVKTDKILIKSRTTLVICYYASKIIGDIFIIVLAGYQSITQSNQFLSEWRGTSSFLFIWVIFGKSVPITFALGLIILCFSLMYSTKSQKIIRIISSVICCLFSIAQIIGLLLAFSMSINDSSPYNTKLFRTGSLVDGVVSILSIVVFALMFVLLRSKKHDYLLLESLDRLFTYCKYEIALLSIFTLSSMIYLIILFTYSNINLQQYSLFALFESMIVLSLDLVFAFVFVPSVRIKMFLQGREIELTSLHVQEEVELEVSEEEE